MKKLAALFLTTLSAPLLADAPAAPAAGDTGFTQTIVMIVVALFFFYFILWRPEQKRRKALETQRSSMKKGDRVVCMGIVGTISRIKDDSIIVHTGDAEIEFLKAAISEVQSPSSHEEAPK